MKLKNKKSGQTTLRLFLILLVTYGCLPPPIVLSTAIQGNEVEHRLGISVSAERLEDINDETLLLLEDLGISLIEIEGLLSETQIERIRNTNLYLFIKQARRFTTPYELEQNEEQYLEQDLSLIRNYDSAFGQRITAYGLFYHPFETSPLMQELMSRYSGKLNASTDRDHDFYYQSAFPAHSPTVQNFSFYSSQYSPGNDLLNASVVQFSPEDTETPALKSFRELLGKTLELDQSIVIVELGWLLEQIEQFEPLTNALQTYAFDQEILFPLPADISQPPLPNWVVIFLIVLLATYLIHYKYQPIYQRFLFRYFTAHRFFAEDVMGYRLRSPITGILLFLQHLILWGLFFWLCAQVFFSPMGLDALFHHFPNLNKFGTVPASFFLWGLLVGLALQTISVLWIHLPNQKTRSLVQTLNLYVWPLHLNLLTIFSMVTLHQSGADDLWLHATFILFIVVLFVSFNIASFDSARFLSRYRLLYLFSTVGIHTVLVFSLILYLYSDPAIWQPVRLALSLP